MKLAGIGRGKSRSELSRWRFVKGGVVSGGEREGEDGQVGEGDREEEEGVVGGGGLEDVWSSERHERGEEEELEEEILWSEGRFRYV